MFPDIRDRSPTLMGKTEPPPTAIKCSLYSNLRPQRKKQLILQGGLKKGFPQEITHEGL